MKPIRKRPGQAGYISYVMVISTGTLLMLATFFVYRTAMNSREMQSKVQMRVDYSEKEDAIMRSIVAIAPNRAMRAMMDDSNADGETRDSLRWSDIFTDALNLANARTSAGADLLQAVGGGERLFRANVGDSEITDISQVFSPIDEVNTNEESTFCTPGINRSMGSGFPPPLQSSVTTTERDATFPIISTDKRYGPLAEGQVGLSPTTYSDFNLIPYPQINFGYTRPGQPFVAKRNWWAFEMDLAAADRVVTKLMAPRRKFVFSIYEVPSQLAISSSSFMALGKHESGAAWNNVTIQGHVFTGRALVEGDVSIDSLASRRSMEISTQSSIGGETFLANPFTPGTRENYQITEGEFYPVSLASESGRVAFIPINRGTAFFDRFHEDNEEESNTVSPTTWNNYTSGALQCAMKLDIVEVHPDTKMPTKLRFQAKPSIDITYDVPNANPDLPFGITLLGSSSRMCVEVMPELFPSFLQTIGASDTATNHSLVVNVDYSQPNLSNPIFNGQYLDKISETPLILNYGLILRQSTNLTTFTKGFSLVSNLRTYIADDFNTTASASGSYPPVSIYVPELRYGTEENPFAVSIEGQVSSLKAEDSELPSRPLDVKGVQTDVAINTNQIQVNLKPIEHPDALPPVYMMNWLVTVEELRGEYTTAP